MLAHFTVVRMQKLVPAQSSNTQRPSCSLGQDKFSILEALKMCAKMANVEKGRTLHAAAVEIGLASDAFVVNSLMDMYAKCSHMQEARGVFDKMESHDTVSYNVLILGYAANGEGWESLIVLCRMLSVGVAANSVTFVAALKACSSLAGEEVGKQAGGTMGIAERGMALHSIVSFETCLLEMKLANSLVSLYGTCGSLSDAHRIFDSMENRSVVTWTNLILGYAQNGKGLAALKLFEEMDCAPDAVTFVAVLKACASLAEIEGGRMQADGQFVKIESLERGMSIHERVVNSRCNLDSKLANTLVDMYCKCCFMLEARKVFDNLACLTAVSWSVLISGYAENGEELEALSLFYRMIDEGYSPNATTFLAALKACGRLAEREEGRQVDGRVIKLVSLEKGVDVHRRAANGKLDSNIKVCSTLVEMYAKCGWTVCARKAFDGMHLYDVQAVTALMLGYVENGQGKEALDLYDQVNCEPDAVAFVAALKACGLIGALDRGQGLHRDIVSRGLQNNPLIATSLIDFYGKCWCMEEAEQVFRALGPGKPDTVAWTALLAGYSRHGDTEQVFQIFNRMQEERVPPNAVTFLCILTSCCHAGLTQKGKAIFDSMPAKFGVVHRPEHYTCMVDLLGRANRMDEVVKLVENIPFAADSVTWTAILAACRKWRNMELGELAFKSLLQCDEKAAAAYVLMADIYRSHGMKTL